MKPLTLKEFKFWLEQYGKASFVHIQSGSRFALYCVFLVEFDDSGLCSLFREWWHLRRFEEL